jgi:hypothetical protein
MVAEKRTLRSWAGGSSSLMEEAGGEAREGSAGRTKASGPSRGTGSLRTSGSGATLLPVATGASARASVATACTLRGWSEDRARSAVT